jgi:hypothetical protein
MVVAAIRRVHWMCRGDARARITAPGRLLEIALKSAGMIVSLEFCGV